MEGEIPSLVVFLLPFSLRKDCGIRTFNVASGSSPHTLKHYSWPAPRPTEPPEVCSTSSPTQLDLSARALRGFLSNLDVSCVVVDAMGYSLPRLSRT